MIAAVRRTGYVGATTDAARAHTAVTALYAATRPGRRRRAPGHPAGHDRRQPDGVHATSRGRPDPAGRQPRADAAAGAGAASG